MIRGFPMNTNLKRSSSGGSTRQAFLTLQGWALGTLIDQGAVTECDHHGHRKDRSAPDAKHVARIHPDH